MTDLRGTWQVGPPGDDVLHELPQPATRRFTVSLYLQTDGRRAANAAPTPAWLVTARNGMREVSARLEQGEDREAKLLWRTRRDEIDDALTALAPGDRGRSLVWFTDLEGELDDRYILQVPVRESLVAFGDQPVIAPLIEVLDHSRPIGVVLASGERVRLLHWAHGTIDEAGEEVFDLEGGGWRPYRGPSSSTPGRGGRSGTTHVEQVEARMEEHRDRFFAEAAQATAQRLDELGWVRVVVAAERPLAALPRRAARAGRGADRRGAAGQRRRRARVRDRRPARAGHRGPAPARRAGHGRGARRRPAARGRRPRGRAGRAGPAPGRPPRA